MDRRIVEGLAGVVLAGVLAGEARAQSSPGRDPSSQPAVGMVPIRSIGDSINSVELPGASNAVPIVSSRVPTSPVGSGPSAAIPNPPVLDEAVSMTPIDPLNHSLTHGFGSGRVASLFRKPGPRPTSSATTTTPRFLPGYAPIPTARPLTPAPIYPQEGVAARPRPSPLAGQIPEAARPQADPVVVPAGATAEGRPSPYARESLPAARPQAPAEPRPSAARPQAEPVVTPLPAGRLELPPPPPLGTLPAVETEPGPSTAVNEVPTGSLPPLERVEPPSLHPPSGSSTPPALASMPPSPSTVESPVMVDDQIRRTSDDESAMKLKDNRLKKETEYITFRAAAVGDEIITINELREAVKLQMKNDPMLESMPRDSPQYQTVMNQVAANTLNNLIDQRLLLKEAKAKMKGKSEQAFAEYVDNIWKTDELPALYNKYGVNNVHELKIKLKNEGKNYQTIKESFCKKVMAQEFLKGEIRHQVTYDLSEKRAYYVAHLKEFERPARITWREIEVNVGRYPDRATARKKADELLARLLHNESFEAIAKACSNGPTASQGGVYVDMTPDSYGIASVNDELNRIPVGQVSQVIETPNSFYIIRVDSRREKGPLRFAEVQEQIQNEVFVENYQKAVLQYLTKLRAKTLVRTMFENTQEGLVAGGKEAPASAPKNDPAVQPASIR